MLWVACVAEANVTYCAIKVQTRNKEAEEHAALMAIDLATMKEKAERCDLFAFPGCATSVCAYCVRL